MNMHAPLGLIDVFAAKLPTLKFVICGGHVITCMLRWDPSTYSQPNCRH